MALNIIFDGPPGPESGRFVEVNNNFGESVKAGEWLENGDGTWTLKIEEMTVTTSVHPFVIPVFWIDSENEIHSGNATNVEGDVVTFDDGGWNWLNDCFMSAEQCRKFHDLDVVIEKMELLIDELRG